MEERYGLGSSAFRLLNPAKCCMPSSVKIVALIEIVCNAKTSTVLLYEKKETNRVTIDTYNKVINILSNSRDGVFSSLLTTQLSETPTEQTVQ